MLDYHKITETVIRNAYAKLGYPFFTRGNFNVNLGIIRSSNRRADEFDDIAYLIFRENGHPQFFKCWATADPGRDHLVNPTFPEAQRGGTAIVAEGFYRGLYTMGWYYGTKALIPVTPMRVYRDKNRDDVLDLDPATIQTGNFGTLWHDHLQNVADAQRVGRSSAGCFNMKRREDHNYFMRICEKAIEMYKCPISLAVLSESQLVY